MGVLAGCPAPDNPGTNIENTDSTDDTDNTDNSTTDGLFALTIGGETVTIDKDALSGDILNVAITMPDGVAVESVSLTEGSGFTLDGKTMSLAFSASSGRYRIRCSAISALEKAFTDKDASVSSDTAPGVMPAFDVARANNDIDTLASWATQENPDVKIVNDIHALYNAGNQILQVSSQTQQAGSINCSELSKIQTTAGNIYADDTLRLSEINREISLANFLDAYDKWGFVFDGNNNFFPKPGNIHAVTSKDLSLDITDTGASIGSTSATTPSGSSIT